MVLHRHVYRHGSSWAWKLHGESATGFDSAMAAARSLATHLGIQVKYLLKKAPGPAPRPELPGQLQQFKGLWWHGQKLGWYVKHDLVKGTKYYIDPAKLVRAEKLKLKLTRRRKLVASAGVWRPFSGVTYSKSKQAWVCQTKDKFGRFRQVAGLHTTQEAAAEALAAYKGIKICNLKKEETSSNISRAAMVSHFEEVQKLFNNFPLRDWLPGDLRDLLMNSSEDASLCAPIRLLISQLKYAPYRNIARAVAKKHKFTEVSEKYVRLLLKKFQDIPSEELAPWRASVGLGVGHHHGMIPLMQNTLQCCRKINGKNAFKPQRGRKKDCRAHCVCHSLCDVAAQCVHVNASFASSEWAQPGDFPAWREREI